jgi:hypothetical protein
LFNNATTTTTTASIATAGSAAGYYQYIDSCYACWHTKCGWTS